MRRCGCSSAAATNKLLPSLLCVLNESYMEWTEGKTQISKNFYFFFGLYSFHTEWNIRLEFFYRWSFYLVRKASWAITYLLMQLSYTRCFGWSFIWLSPKLKITNVNLKTFDSSWFSPSSLYMCDILILYILFRIPQPKIHLYSHKVGFQIFTDLSICSPYSIKSKNNNSQKFVRPSVRIL